MIYDLDFYVQHTRDDLEFFRMWREQNNYEWPRTIDFAVHPGLRRPVCRYCRFYARHGEHTASASTIINRYNSAVNVFRSFWSGDGTYDSGSDSDSD